MRSSTNKDSYFFTFKLKSNWDFDLTISKLFFPKNQPLIGRYQVNSLQSQINGK